MTEAGMKESEYFSLHKTAVLFQLSASTMDSSVSLNAWACLYFLDQVFSIPPDFLVFCLNLQMLMFLS